MIKLIKKEDGQGVICKKEKRRIWVVLESECSSDSPSKECGGGCLSCSSKSNARKTSIPLTDSSSLKLGERVFFSHYIPDPAVTGFVVFGVPIIFALLTMLLWYLNAPDRVESPLAIISTGVGFFCGFSVLKVLDLFFSRKYPAILKEQTERNFSEKNG